MNEERDVATATRPEGLNTFAQPPVTPPIRIETPRAGPPPSASTQPPQSESRVVGGMVFTREQIELLKRTIAKDASDDELYLFLYQCQRTRLDPFTRQCYFMKRTSWDKSKQRNITTFQFETSIDGLRLIAERTDKYAGQVAPEWADVQTTDHGVTITWYPLWPFRDREPYAARVGVLRKDFAQPLYAVARFDAYVQTVDIWENGHKTDEKRLNAMWQKRGAEQLAKCAESLALRQAFPNEMSGLYTSEEMGQADNDRGDDDERVEEGREPTHEPRREPKRRGTKQERSERANRLHRHEPTDVFAGMSVSRYPVRFPFGQPPYKGAALDENALDVERHPIPREYIISSDLLARAFDWAQRALDGKQTIDEIIDGKKTGKKVPVVLDADRVKQLTALVTSVQEEIERRQIEREEARVRDPLPDNTAVDDARELLAEEKGEAYEGE